ncbi:hypothetical protein EVAR_32204_1 [Eumeta japonica]|uniref:Uncharacterized protein n=1 Tax=Eumeta variegata TaxID=151549 RepID=A0A4C1VX97_EUMVA|nr:hypothetical protein EVAR_32204_1 [Eumeta japonica]
MCWLGRCPCAPVRLRDFTIKRASIATTPARWTYKRIARGARARLRQHNDKFSMTMLNTIPLFDYMYF